MKVAAVLGAVAALCLNSVVAQGGPAELFPFPTPTPSNTPSFPWPTPLPQFPTGPLPTPSSIPEGGKPLVKREFPRMHARQLAPIDA